MHAGSLVKKARLAAGVTQVQLAKRMKMAQTKVSFYEGRKDMKLSLAIRFAKALKLEVCELLQCHDKPTTP